MLWCLKDLEPIFPELWKFLTIYDILRLMECSKYYYGQGIVTNSKFHFTQITFPFSIKALGIFFTNQEYITKAIQIVRNMVKAFPNIVEFTLAPYLPWLYQAILEYICTSDEVLFFTLRNTLLTLKVSFRGREYISKHLLEKLSNLTNLEIRSCIVSDELLDTITKLDKLSVLQFGNGCCFPNPNYLFGSIFCLSSLTKIDLGQSNFRKINNEAIQVVYEIEVAQKTNKNVRCLEVVGSNWFNNNSLRYISHITSLTSLKLSYCPNIDDEGLLFLQSLSNLSNLTLSQCSNISDNGLFRFNQPKHNLNLTYLDLSNNSEKISDFVLSSFRHNGGIQTLILDNFSQIDFGYMLSGMFLCSMSSITELRMSSCRITDTTLSYLARLSNLITLDLSANFISDVGFKYISVLKSLTLLDISSCDNFVGVGLISISYLTNLTHLDISNCHNFKEEEIFHISKISSLSKLIVFGSNISPITDLKLQVEVVKTTLIVLGDTETFNYFTAIEPLEFLRCLLTLKIYNCQISDNELLVLSSLQSLKCLCLKSLENIIGAGLAHISGLTNLTTLELSNCDNVMDLSHLYSFTSIKYLTIFDCISISETELVNLFQFLNENIKQLKISSRENWWLNKHLMKFNKLHTLEICVCNGDVRPIFDVDLSLNIIYKLIQIQVFQLDGNFTSVRDVKGLKYANYLKETIKVSSNLDEVGVKVSQYCYRDCCNIRYDPPAVS